MPRGLDRDQNGRKWMPYDNQISVLRLTQWLDIWNEYDFDPRAQPVADLMQVPKPKLDITNLQRASREPVIGALSGLAGKAANVWLPTGHPAATGQFLKKNGIKCRCYTEMTEAFTPRHIVDVLAATGPSHCSDGWTFFARALAALLSGDTHTACQAPFILCSVKSRAEYPELSWHRHFQWRQLRGR